MVPRLEGIENRLYELLKINRGGLQAEITALFISMVNECPKGNDSLRTLAIAFSQSSNSNDRFERDTLLHHLWRRIDDLKGADAKEDYLDRIAVGIVRGDMAFDEDFIEFLTESASHVGLAPEVLERLLQEHITPYRLPDPIHGHRTR
jgi:hypothetical protein